MPSNVSFIVYGKRTPIGKLSGAFAKTQAPVLGSALVKDALKETGLQGELVDEIIMGCVLPAGIGQAPARQAAIFGGLPHAVCATTVNRVCGSGLKTVMLADQAIRIEDSEIVFAGGMENMTLAPHLLSGSRAGYRFGPIEAKDHMQWDGLWDPYANVPMGSCGEVCAKEYRFSREEQDEFALESYRRSRGATESGHFLREILPVEIKVRRSTTIIDKDEEPFSVDLDRLKSLSPVFAKDGTVTAGNASSINDGAALTVIASERAVKEHSLNPIAKIIAQCSFAQDPTWFTTSPIQCIRKLFKKTGLKVEDIDLFEINEAFAVVPMAAIKDLNLDPSKVNPFGGAVSLGHPIGASGTRVLVTLLNGLKALGKKRGLATLCIGGGEASAVIVEMM
jgi:acetyl-CoA C-acetyltransferase